MIQTKRSIFKRLKDKTQNYFSSGHERSIVAKRNIASSLLVKGLTVVIGFILLPLTISYVNRSNFGLWLTLSSIITWLNSFDIGLANGLKNKLAESHANNDNYGSRIYLSTTYVLIGALATLIFTLFLAINHYLNWQKILNAERNTSENYNNLAVVVIGIFCIQFIVQIMNVVLTATHASAKMAWIGLCGQGFSLVLIFIFPFFAKGSLLNLILIIAVAPLLVQIIASFWYYTHEYRVIAPSIKYIRLKHAKSLLSSGGIFFLVQIGGLLLFQTDNIVITQLFGPADVTLFNVTYKLFSIVSIVFTIVLTPFWSAFTDAFVKLDYDWIKQVFNRMYKYFLLLIIATILLLIGSPLIFKLWLGKEFSIPISLSLVMSVYVLEFCWMLIHCFFLNGIGKIRLQLYLYIGSTSINIPMAIYLGRFCGIQGVTLSNIIVMFIMGVVLYIQCRKIVNKSAVGIWDK